MGESGSASPGFFVVAVAASTGGLHAISQVLSGLPADFPGAVLVLQHLEAGRTSLLPEILARRTQLPVRPARHGGAIRPATVFVAPPGHHMLVRPGGRLALTRTPLVQFVRPSADLLFESVALIYQHRAVAVILTGTGRDGVEGARIVRRHGGIVIAQSFETSECFGMPGAAIRDGSVHRVLALAAIGPALELIVNQGEGAA